MAVYRYRALTPNGVVVSNRIEENNRSAVIKKLKRNNLTPINITEQIAISKKPVKTKKRNIKDVEDIIKNANTTNLMANREKNRQSYIQKINQALSKTGGRPCPDVQIAPVHVHHALPGGTPGGQKWDAEILGKGQQIGRAHV